jgi:hypothetical protein
MKTNHLLLVVLFLFGLIHGAVAAGPEDAIVKLMSVLRVPSPVRPWTKQNPMKVGGTGVVLDGKRIRLDAHLVTYTGESIAGRRRPTLADSGLRLREAAVRSRVPRVSAMRGLGAPLLLKMASCRSRLARSRAQPSRICRLSMVSRDYWIAGIARRT